MIVWHLGLHYLIRFHEKRTGSQPHRFLGWLAYLREFNRTEWWLLLAAMTVSFAVGWASLIAGWYFLLR